MTQINDIETIANLLKENNLNFRLTLKRQDVKGKSRSRKLWRWSAACFHENGFFLAQNSRSIDRAINKLLQLDIPKSFKENP